MSGLIRIATAECFTHGKIAREIHAFSQGYPLSYKWTINPKNYKLSLIAGLFIPTISGIKKILKFEPLPPTEVIDDIKVYDETADKKMAKKMAMAIKDITGADVGIGTTAGVGRGGIAVISDEIEAIGSSDVYADLRSSPATEIMKRQQSGVEKALKLLEDTLPSII
ncbi:hypothetical protein MTTB_02740 [Methanothermobacter tenebrarum]|uniref:UPF0254 protein MTTB_02740 n=1 Tax=Methanothermobacter tenebrarum TaxID=680118 RepID=A0ABM7YCD1_9EURY|nr:UPF0254 family protein [Methanothermobacter tenebrarum]MDD3454823.1 UPF0254 family protein [Methanobacteriales archaeon]MDI6882267.1 UPF0254 family protein [Methanothermobacter sp.]MDX9693718.1 UPF0254 family protein [Methanothermobacter sp.]BDH78895.1 hypothetical protein MTTB_02740 [Methanothermobacter tenebrarum]HOQ20525.1 UPF0254 family protein [Methanothermobacter sp.]